METQSGTHSGQQMLLARQSCSTDMLFSARLLPSTLRMGKDSGRHLYFPSIYSDVYTRYISTTILEIRC